VAEGVDASPDVPQAFVPEPPSYLTGGHAQLEELNPGYHSVLALGEVADPGVDRERLGVTARDCHAGMLTTGGSQNKSGLQRNGTTDRRVRCV
jgi:hypothetical protein